MVDPKFTLALVWLIGFTLISIENKSLPNFVKQCKRHQPDLESCLIDLANGISARLPRGIRELGIPALDPLEIPYVDFRDEQEFFTNIEYAIFNNVTVKGTSNFTIRNLTIDWETPKMITDIDFPFVKTTCNYNISASTFGLPIFGDGYFEGNFTNVSSHSVIYGEYYNKDNKKFVKVANQTISLDIESSQANFKDSGNPLKNTAMNGFWSVLFAIIKPRVEDKTGELAVSLFQEMIKMFDIDSLVPE